MENIDSKNYYEILGIDRNANAELIRKTYVKLVKKYHPDLHQDQKEEYNKIFIKIKEAYETLSDPIKRKDYDNINTNQNIFNNFKFDQNTVNDLLSKFVTGGIFKNKINKPSTIKNIDYNLELDVRTIYKGKTIEIQYTKKYILNEFDMPIPLEEYHNSIIICDKCSGSGITKQDVEISLGIKLGKEILCSKCNGSTKIVRNGYRIGSTSDKIKLNVKHGTKLNSSHVFKQKGHMVPGFPISDLVIHVLEKEEKGIKLIDNDIYMDWSVTVENSLLKRPILFIHLNGTKYLLNPNCIIKPGMIKKIQRLGMNVNDNIGDLYLTFNVIFPNSLSSDKIEVLNSLWTENKFDDDDDLKTIDI